MNWKVLQGKILVMVKLKTLKLLICFSVSCFFLNSPVPLTSAKLGTKSEEIGVRWSVSLWSRSFRAINLVPLLRLLVSLLHGAAFVGWATVTMSWKELQITKLAGMKYKQQKCFHWGILLPFVFFLLTFNMLLWQPSILKTCTSCAGWLLQSWEGLVFPACWQPWLFTYK